jgi:hypothetical protein
MKRIVLICPTRGRDDLHRMLAESWLASRWYSRLVFVVPEEHRQMYREVAGCEYLYHPVAGITGMTLPLNWAAMQLVDQADSLMALGHDTIIKTMDWERLVMAHVGKKAVIYPDDGIQHEWLPTMAWLDARVVKALGYMAPPSIKHLYIDNFWHTLGSNLESIKYLPDVYFEHVHPTVGKRAWDETTGQLNTREAYQAGKDQFLAYMCSRFFRDLDKAKAAMQC